MALRRDRKKNRPERIPGATATGERRRVVPEEARARRGLAVTMLKSGFGHEEIVEKLIETHAGMTEHSAREVIGDARKILQAQSAALQRDGRDLQIIRLHDHVRRAITRTHANGAPNPNLSVAVQAEREIAKVLGNYTPIRHEVSADISLAQQKLELLGVMSGQEIQNIIDEAKRRKVGLLGSSDE